jgi:hypothetical protein
VTIADTIAEPCLGNTLMILTLELIRRTFPKRTVLGFVRLIAAVVIAVAIEALKDALVVQTLELIVFADTMGAALLRVLIARLSVAAIVFTSSCKSNQMLTTNECVDTTHAIPSHIQMAGIH